MQLQAISANSTACKLTNVDCNCGLHLQHCLSFADSTSNHSTIVEADPPWSKLSLFVQPVVSKEGCKNERVLFIVYFCTFSFLFPSNYLSLRGLVN
jgi:hypothetical protein